MSHELTLSLDHKFSDRLSLHTALAGTFFDGRDRYVTAFDFDPQTNQVFRTYQDRSPLDNSTYSWQTNLNARFNTGSIQYQLLAGVDLVHSISKDGFTNPNEGFFNDLFNPTYNNSTYKDPSSKYFNFKRESTSDSLGVYLQDQVTLLPNLKLLLGGRYDVSSGSDKTVEIFQGERTESYSDSNAGDFSPRVGIVYQPIAPISLYAVFSQSFNPQSGLTRQGEPFGPERGTQ